MTELHIQIPDVHAPHEDKHAIRAILDMLRYEQPTGVFQSGDLLDTKAPARWSKGRAEEYVSSMRNEVDSGIRFWDNLRRAVPNATLTWVSGNHEDRLRNYVNTYAPAIADIMPDMAELMKLGDFGVNVAPKPWDAFPGVRVIHGKLLDSTAGFSARKEVERHGMSIIQSHTHRLGLWFKTTDKTRFGLEAGHLCDIAQASYLDFPEVANWQQGFGYVYVDGNRVQPGIVHIHKGGRFTFNGRNYSGKDKT